MTFATGAKKEFRNVHPFLLQGLPKQERQKFCAGKHTPTGTFEPAHGSLCCTHARARPHTHVTCAHALHAHVRYDPCTCTRHAARDHACPHERTNVYACTPVRTHAHSPHVCPTAAVSLKEGPGFQRPALSPTPQDVTPASSGSIRWVKTWVPMLPPSESGLASAPLPGKTDRGVRALGPRAGKAEGQGCDCPSPSANVKDSSAPSIKRDQRHRVLEGSWPSPGK